MTMETTTAVVKNTAVASRLAGTSRGAPLRACPEVQPPAI